MMMNRLAASLEAPLPGEQRSNPVGLRPGLAERRPSLRAGNAVTTTRHKNQDAWIAGFEVIDPPPAFDHEPSRLMAQTHRPRPTSQARRVGRECGSPCKPRGSPPTKKQK